MEKITVAQAGALGGKKRWSNINHIERKKEMRRVAIEGWKIRHKKLKLLKV